LQFEAGCLQGYPLGCVLKPICTPTEMPREALEGDPKQYFAGLLPGPSRKSHERSIPKSPEEHRGMQKPKLRTRRNGDHVRSPPRAVPAEPQPQRPGVKPITMSCGEHLYRLPVGLRGVAGLRCGTHKGMQGKSFWGLRRTGQDACLAMPCS